MLKKRYTITEAADILRIRTHTLRYWEEELELEIPRNEMGHRVYYDEQIAVFEEVRRLKEQGYQLTAIRMQLQNKQTNHMLDTETDKEFEETLPFRPANEVGSKAVKLEQFQLLMNEIVKNAMEENNQQLCTRIEERILKEMNYLMREQEENARERYLQLDQLLRQVVAKKSGKKEKKKKLSMKKGAVTKCSPLTNTL